MTSVHKNQDSLDTKQKQTNYEQGLRQSTNGNQYLQQK